MSAVRDESCREAFLGTFVAFEAETAAPAVDPGRA